MRLIGKRGTDKPIEIFIALFVILAVAMVILKMFSSQVEQKQRELRDAADKAKLEEAKATLNEFCDARCSEAVDEESMVTYCKTYYDRQLDLNNNKNYDDYTESISLAGACEDRVYCAQYKPCGALTMKTCIQRLCTYFKNNWNKADDASQSTELAKFIQPGSCYENLDEEQKGNHWYTKLFSDNQPGAQTTCFTGPTCLQNINQYAATYGFTPGDCPTGSYN